MVRQVYADNVDANGKVFETVGENIRKGAKDAESVVKALQPEDITFDMQAVMNVLPFMDSTKKIVEINITASDGKWHSDKLEHLSSQYGVGVNTPCYGYVIGEINRGELKDPNKLSAFITASPLSTNKFYIKFSNGLTSEDDTTNTKIKVYIVTDK